MARDFNHIVQWDILFHRKVMVSHLLDEYITLTVASILADQTPATKSRPFESIGSDDSAA